MDVWVLVSIGLLMATLVSGRVQPAIAFSSLAGMYLITGLVEVPDLLGSFANPALATLLLLLLVSLALERSPLMDQISAKLLTGREKPSLIRLMSVTALLSAFLNNTAIVASFLGTLSRQTRIPPSRLLIPLSYASLLGGITTLIGTSTNLVVSSFVIDAGLPELNMFHFSLVGIPVAIISLLVLTFSASFLPSNLSQGLNEQPPYFLAAEVTAESALVGKSIDVNAMRNLDGLYLLEIEREGHLISPVGPDEIIHPHDILIFTGEVSKVQTLQRFSGLNLLGENADQLLASNLVEVLISHESTLINRTLQEVDFRTLFNAGVVGIRRGGKHLKGQLGRIPLRMGDSLLLAVGGDFSQHRNLDRNFHLLSDSLQRPCLSIRQSLAAFGGFAAALISATLGGLNLFEALLCLMGVFLLTGLLNLSELRRRFPFELLLIIGSALTIAKALQTSGGVSLIAEGVQTLFYGYGVYAAFIGVYCLTLVLTEAITNIAAAALAFPIALSTAQALNVDPMPFVMGVAYGASACFLVPFGYQTHLIVYSPGRYRLQDYFKTGLPVSLAYSMSVLILTPWVFPFTPD